MTLALRYFDGCPNWRVAESRIRQALSELGRDDEHVLMERVETHEDAERLGFRGSPTLLVDGRDPFDGGTASVGLSCRVYRTEAGIEGSPSVRQLIEAIDA